MDKSIVAYFFGPPCRLPQFDGRESKPYAAMQRRRTINAHVTVESWFTSLSKNGEIDQLVDYNKNTIHITTLYVRHILLLRGCVLACYISGLPQRIDRQTTIITQRRRLHQYSTATSNLISIRKTNNIIAIVYRNELYQQPTILDNNFSLIIDMIYWKVLQLKHYKTTTGWST